MPTRTRAQNQKFSECSKSGDTNASKLKSQGAPSSWLVAVTCCLSVAIILVCARGNLWLDEILSLQWGRNANSPLDLLLLFRHDNNHPLNSAWLMFVGEGAHPLVQRLPAILSGGLSLLLIFRIGAIVSPVARFVPLFLAAFSFPLILYSSEARGYAPALFFLLLSLWFLFNRPIQSFGELFLFWLVTLLAILSHASAIYLLTAFALWSLFRFRMAEQLSWRKAFGRAVILFSPAGLFSLAFYWIFLRQMMIAGGPYDGIISVLASLFGYGFGLPTLLPLGAVSLLVGGVYLSSFFIWASRRQPTIRILFACIVATFVLALLMGFRAEYLAFRYFLVFLPFFYLMAGPLWETIAEQGANWRVAAALLLTCCSLFGHVPRIFQLALWGRGGYPEALRFIASQTDGGCRISGNHEMAVGIVMAYYQRRDPTLLNLEYLPTPQVGRPEDDWLILAYQWPERTSSHLKLEGVSYTMVKTFSSGSVSGFSWGLFRRSDPLQSATENHTTKPDS